MARFPDDGEVRAYVISVDQVLNETNLAASDIEGLAGMPRASIEGGANPTQFKQGHPTTDHEVATFCGFRRLVN